MDSPADRTVLVDVERLPRWFADFAERHGRPEVAVTGSGGGSAVILSAPDGAAAECAVDVPGPALRADAPWGGLLDHLAELRRIGILLIRRGGYAAGVFEDGTLVASKVGSRYVQGRTAAGGQSQQRFARRRANQTDAVVAAAVEIAERVLGPAAQRLDAVYGGGDRALLSRALADRRLSAVAARPRGRFLAVGEPRLAELKRAGRQARAVPIRVTDPAVA